MVGATLDGLGWWIELSGMLMKTYGWTEAYIMDELDGAKSWCYYNFAVQSEAQVWGTGVKIVGDGYVAQERKRIQASKK